MTSASGRVGPLQLVAGVVVDGDRVLMCLRSAGRAWYPRKWDLVGGHVEPGESAAKALVREAREEVGIRLSEPLGPRLTTVVTKDAEIAIWLVEGWSGEPKNTAPAEHEAIGWFDPGTLDLLDLAHPNYLTIIKEALAARQRQASNSHR
ncbi:MAG TPA: NUDIX domain-containing protein [Actinocrinis sp.]|uniref:NUDIX domain-containing protein n=1 Tax=Actinocrinis sp. TaxID=1920516 RepID=UPI002DDCC255|nr:NUDIX domain-containing protein [Actinocrinis sp.]HEV2346762.1 NUDIX domain-containing protein [Actinocrinis sp.]